MKREWKPGDVAMACGSGFEGQVFRYSEPDSLSDEWKTATEGDYYGGEVRPLVVIDPEDREAVERLASALTSALINVPGGGCMRANTTQAALRSLVAPPRPAEPQLLAALVRDADDLLWIKVDRGSHPWRSAEPEPRKARWSDLGEPEVLLPGWDAGVGS